MRVFGIEPRMSGANEHAPVSCRYVQVDHQSSMADRSFTLRPLRANVHQQESNCTGLH